MGTSGAIASLAEVLQNNRVLENLSLNDCDIRDDGIGPIAQGQSSLCLLTYIPIPQCLPFSSPLLALAHNRTLLTLELGTNGLSDNSAQHIGDALRFNNTLEGLSLWQNEISGQGAQSLAEGLQV